MTGSIAVTGELRAGYDEILTTDALAFVERLQAEFGPRRLELLDARAARQARIDAGEELDFLPETAPVRDADWTVAPAPADLNDRRVEITGPVDRKMVINALNCGAKVFMADFEDANSPTWDNVVQGQINLRDAIRRTISFDNPDGRRYELNEDTATLVVRPRGWHLYERHVALGGQPVSASLFDFGLYMFHNARELLERGSGPYFYLPKLQGHREARLWNDVFVFAQDALGIPQGSIRATVLVEHIMAAFEMDEILYELRDHASGLNAGRWDYIFSIIKVFRDRPEFVLPDRMQVTMAVPFMHAYTELLVRTCHRRGAHAIGGMAAFIPTRRDPEANELAMSKVHEDKRREASAGFDGTWVAHPGLVPIAGEEFGEFLAERPHQKERARDDVRVAASDLLDVRIPDSSVTEQGVRSNVSIALQYLNAWLGGSGAAAIFNLMEDVATAEISRAQLWQLIRHQVTLADGAPVTAALYSRIRDEELAALGGPQADHYATAASILDELVLNDEFTEFLTFVAYSHLS
jgi:malate synthase